MNVLEELEKLDCYLLTKISSKTYPHDTLVTLTRAKRYTRKEIEAVAKMLMGGRLYKCSIGKRRFYFGSSAAEAATGAIKAYQKELKTKKPKKKRAVQAMVDGKIVWVHK
jgi:hypothetical protein